MPVATQSIMEDFGEIVAVAEGSRSHKKKKKKLDNCNNSDNSSGKLKRRTEMLNEDNTKPVKKKKRNKADDSSSSLIESLDKDSNISESPKKKKKKKKRDAAEESSTEDTELERQEADTQADIASEGSDSEDETTQRNSKLQNSVPLSFSAPVFRKKLFSPQVGTELLEFSTSLVKGRRRDVAKEYFEAGGSASEILAAMAECRRVAPASVIAALKILQILFLRALRDFPEQQMDSEEAALSLLQTATPFLNSLLAPSQSNTRLKTVLQLLTAMASLSGRVAREVLRGLALGKDEVRRLTAAKGADWQQEVRSSFLHLLLAFLVDGDIATIQLLLAKEGVLGTALLGLVHDPAPMVHLVLTTLRSQVLENSGVSKRLKQRAFNTRVLESLVLLYEWQGIESAPVKRFGKFHHRRQSKGEIEATPEDIQLVQEAVHAFLSLLLTSHKLGVVYASQGVDTPAAKHNHQAFTVLRRLRRPWESALQDELVVQVLKACPTLIKPTLTVHVESLTPRPTHAWLRAIDFVIKVLSSVEMEDALRGRQDTLGSRGLASTAESLTLPISLLQKVLAPGLAHSHTGVREGCARLLVCVLDRLTAHVSYVEKQQLLLPSAINDMKQIIAAKLAQIVPGVNVIWEAWALAAKMGKPELQKVTKKRIIIDFEEFVSSSSSSSDDEMEPKKTALQGLKTSEKPQKITDVELLAPDKIMAPKAVRELDNPSRSSHLATLLSLLLGYQRWLPHWVEGGHGTSKGAELLRNVRKTARDLGEEESKKLQVQAICLLSSFDSLAISPNQPMIMWIVPLLVSEAAQSSEARSALQRLLTRLALLQENPYELDLWLWSLEQKKETVRNRSNYLLHNGLIYLAKDPLKYTERKYEKCLQYEEVLVASQEQQLEEMLEELAEEMKLKSAEEKLEDVSRTPNNGLAFSPLILAVLEVAKELPKTYLRYNKGLGSVAVRLMQQQSHPGPILQMLSNYMNALPPSALEYVQKWHQGERCELPKYLVTKEEMKLDNYLRDETTQQPSFKETLAPRLLRQLFLATIFHVAHALTTDGLGQQLAERAWTIIQSVLSIAPADVTRECLDSVLVHPLLLGSFSLKAKSSSARLATELVLKLASTAFETGNLGTLAALRQKTLHQLSNTLAKYNQNKPRLLSWCAPGKLSQLISQLSISRKELGQVLDAACLLPESAWLTKDFSALSDPGELAACMLQRLVHLREEAKEEGTSAALALSYPQCADLALKVHQLAAGPGADADLSLLEDSLSLYLEMYPHHIGDMPKGLFGSLLERDDCLRQRLASLLVSRDVNLAPELGDWVKGANLIAALPLLWALHRAHPGSLAPETLKSAWENLQERAFKSLWKPAKTPDWLKANIDTVLFLMEHSLDADTAKVQLSRVRKDKVMAAGTVHARLVVHTWRRAEADLGSLVYWLLKSLILTLQDQTTQQSELSTVLCKELVGCLKTPDLLLSDLGSGDTLLEFCKCALRLGVGGETELLEVLADILQKSLPCPQHQEAWDMLLSHSQFLPSLLGNKQHNKIGVLRVMSALAVLQPSLMTSAHVPVLLGAYHASLSTPDQLILKLLRNCETRGVSLHELRPLVWGEAAVARYALRSQTNLSLWNQPSSSQAIKLLEQTRVDVTLARFPLQRGLADESDADPDSEVYDPAFLLPLLSQLLGPEIPVQPWLVTRQALGICLMALTSTRPDTRLAAQLAIARLHFHLEAGRLTVEKKLWLRFLDTLRLSVCPPDDASPSPLPPLLGLFLARASQVLSQPEHPLYAPLHRFVLARPALDTAAVPDLLRLLHSAEPENRAHRLWILEVLRDGIRTPADFALFSSSFAFKLLACLHNSPLADAKTKVEVLHVLSAVLKVQLAAWRLVSSSGLLSWLQGAVTTLPPPPASQDTSCELSKALVALLGDVWLAATTPSQDESKAAGFTQLVGPSLTHSLLLVLPKLPARVPVLLSLLTTLCGVCQTCPRVCPLISETHLRQLIGLANKAAVRGLAECEDLITFGCTYALNTRDRVDTSDQKKIQSLLCQLVIIWKSARKV